MNLTRIVVILVVIVGVAIVAVYLMGMWEPTKPLADVANGATGALIKAATDNPVITTLVGSGGLAVAGGAVLGKIDTLNQKVSNTQTVADSQINGLLQEKDKIEKTLKAQTDQATEQITNLQTQVTQANGAKTLAEQKQQEAEQAAEKLRLQIQQMTDENALAKAFIEKKDSRLMEATTSTVP